MMRYPFHWFTQSLWTLYVPRLTNFEIARAVQDIVTKHVRPMVDDVTTIDRYLSFLIKYEPPHFWASTNPAIRAAQIVVLASKVGMPSDRIRSILMPRLDVIAHGFITTSPMKDNPAAYINGILSDWFDKPQRLP